MQARSPRLTSPHGISYTLNSQRFSTSTSCSSAELTSVELRILPRCNESVGRFILRVRPYTRRKRSGRRFAKNCRLPALCREAWVLTPRISWMRPQMGSRPQMLLRCVGVAGLLWNPSSRARRVLFFDRARDVGNGDPWKLPVGSLMVERDCIIFS